jgi:signal transduction histidine kinase/ligand-binding sensor domain-containing protein
LKPPKVKICSLIFLLLAVLAAKGQPTPKINNEYLQTVWTTEQGLPQNSVNAIVQSRDGYLWLATFGGLARFDGVKFTTYNSGNTPGLKSNRIISLFEDRDGTLWMGTQSGEVMTLANGVGKTYTTDDGLPGNYVWTIAQAADGTIWIGGEKGAARFENGRFKTFSTADGLPDRPVRVILPDENNQLWFASDSGLLSKFDGEKFIVDSRFSQDKPFYFIKMCRRQSGGFWIGVEELLTEYDNGNFSNFSILPDGAQGKVRTLIETRDKILWINHEGTIYHFKNGAFTPYLKGYFLRSMFEDREGNIWLGSDGKGLYRLRKRNLKTISAEDGLADGVVRAVTGDGADGVWIATNRGLARWQGSSLKFFLNQEGTFSTYIISLFREPDGGLWIGNPGKISYFKDGNFSNISLRETLPNDDEVNAIMRDREGSLWVGSKSGLSILKPDGKETALNEKDGLVNNEVHHISQSKDGAMWIGTTGGLSRYKDGAFTNYTTANGLSNDYVRDVFEDADSSFWLATYGGGLNLLRDGKITPITVKDGLFDDFLSRILTDERGNFWILSNRGIFKVRRDNLNDFVAKRISFIITTSYGVDDGMRSSEGNGGMQPAGWRMPDGKLWFPTIAGVAIIDPNQTAAPMPTVIEQVLLNGAEIRLGDKIEIKPGQENLEIVYSGLSLTRPEQIKFKYKIEGLNDDWVNAGTRRTAYFSYLPPGEYTFKVAGNNDGIWSEPATIKIVVNPPFWRTWWFILLCFLAAALLIYGLFRLRILQLQRQNIAQKEFSRRLINAHESERRRIAAELHDSIGQSLATIKNSAIFAVQSVKDLTQAKEQFEEITEESGNAIAEVREIAYNLRPHLLDRLGLTKAISSMLNRTADNLQMKMFLQIDDIDDLFDNEAELSIFRIIQESLNNILKHAEASEIRVTIERQEDLVNIKIEDNGKGFDTTSQNQSGFGLLGITERVRMLGGTLLINSEIEKGTTTEIKLEGEKGRRGEGEILR